MNEPVHSDQLHLVEDFSPEILNQSGLILALTPEACFQLQKHGKPYRIWEDYYSEDELLDFEKGYLAKLLEWFNNIDNRLKTLVPELAQNNWQLVHELRFRLKYLIDSLVYVSHCSRHVLARLTPKEIHYWKSSPLATVGLDSLADNSRRFIEPCFRLLAEKMNIPFSHKTEFQQQMPEKVVKKIPNVYRKYAKLIYSYFKYAKWRSAGKYTANVLFLTAGHKDSDPVLRDLIKFRAHVFVLSEGQIIDLNSLSNKKLHDLNAMDNELFSRMQSQLGLAGVEILGRADFWFFLNQTCGIATESILRPYFRLFFESVCPSVIGRIPRLRKFLDDYRIDSLVARAATHNHEASFRMAAACTGTKRVCLQHGCQAIDCEMVKLAHAEYFDYFFAADPESKAYVAKELVALNSSCQIKEYSELLRPPRRKKQNSKKEKIIYLPTRGPVGVRIFHNTKYPITWYYHLQIAILDSLAEVKDKDFYFKHAGISDWLEGSTLEYLRQKKYPNINVISRPFSECLTWADRIVMDYPATSFYEAAAADIPLLAMHHKRIPIRGYAKQVFGKSLAEFDDHAGMKKILLDFLSASVSQLKEYTPGLALTNVNTASQLIGIKRGVL